MQKCKFLREAEEDCSKGVCKQQHKIHQTRSNDRTSLRENVHGKGKELTSTGYSKYENENTPQPRFAFKSPHEMRCDIRMIIVFYSCPVEDE
jgi:hypothetical protein